MTPCSHRRRRKTVVPCHTDSIAVQNKGSAELGGGLKAKRYRDNACTTTCSRRRGTQTVVPYHTNSMAVQNKGTAEVGPVASASWPCVCGDVSCTSPCSHRRGTQTEVPCHTDYQCST